MSPHNGIGKSPRNRERSMAQSSFRERPTPDFTLDPFHGVLRGASVATAVILPVYFLFRAFRIDGNLPMQYTFSGGVSRVGSPAEAVLGISFLGLITVGVAVLTRYPQFFNFPFGLTEDNIQRQYKNAVQMLIWMTTGMALIMVVMLGSWLGFLPVTMSVLPVAVLGVSLVFFIVRMARIR